MEIQFDEIKQVKLEKMRHPSIVNIPGMADFLTITITEHDGTEHEVNIFGDINIVDENKDQTTLA